MPWLPVYHGHPGRFPGPAPAGPAPASGGCSGISGHRPAADEIVRWAISHPELFDIIRSPNPHLGFGGTGTHYCIGVNLARLEIELIFNAIADAMPGIRANGAPERLRSGWLNGIKRLPVRYR